MTKMKLVNTMLAVMGTQGNIEMKVEVIAKMKMVDIAVRVAYWLRIVILIESDL